MVWIATLLVPCECQRAHYTEHEDAFPTFREAALTAMEWLYEELGDRISPHRKVEYKMLIEETRATTDELLDSDNFIEAHEKEYQKIEAYIEEQEGFGALPHISFWKV